MLKERLYGTTSSGGALTVTSSRFIHGVVYAVTWIDGTLADGVGAVLSYTDIDGVSRTLLTLTAANDDAVYYPRHAVHNNTGTAQSTLEMPIVHGNLKLVISSGGDTKEGGCVVSFFRAED